MGSGSFSGCYAACLTSNQAGTCIWCLRSIKRLIRPTTCLLLQGSWVSYEMWFFSISCIFRYDLTNAVAAHFDKKHWSFFRYERPTWTWSVFARKRRSTLHWGTLYPYRFRCPGVGKGIAFAYVRWQLEAFPDVGTGEADIPSTRWPHHLSLNV